MSYLRCADVLGKCSGWKQHQLTKNSSAQSHLETKNDLMIYLCARISFLYSMRGEKFKSRIKGLGCLQSYQHSSVPIACLNNWSNLHSSVCEGATKLIPEAVVQIIILLSSFLLMQIANKWNSDYLWLEHDQLKNRRLITFSTLLLVCHK